VKGTITLVSIARSGTPIGVVLARTLRCHCNREVYHYCVSVVRDKGVDRNAFKKILSLRPDDSIILVDGWTGKGVIAHEVLHGVAALNRDWGTNISEGLAVLSDLAGVSSMAAGTDDYLIPSCLLNSVVSGLISRTIVAPSLIGSDDYHG
jgi:hypothetical protein